MASTHAPLAGPRAALAGLLAALGLLLLPGLAAADVVVLKDGRRIEGEIVKADAQEVVLKSGLGQLTFQRAEVKELVYQKTKRQLYDEKREAAETADDWFALGEWCLANKMRTKAPGCFEQAVELDPDHEPAHLALGHVQHEGEWMTPEERDRRVQAAFEAEMAARGLVLHEGRWVTAEEKEHLEKGWVLHEGRWMPEAEKMGLLGYAKVGDRWVHASEARAREHAQVVAGVAGRPFAVAVGANALVAGPVASEMLGEVSEGLDRGRAWFDAAFGLEPGLDLLGGSVAEFYVFADDDPYVRSVPHFAEVGDYLPEGWAEAVAASPGFYVLQPQLWSSARRGFRADLDLRGHCYQHWGHLLAGTLDANGRLLPPWYDEGFACRTEFEVHGKNRVFTRGGSVGTSGTRSARAVGTFDSTRMRDGDWRVQLTAALDAGGVPTLRELTALEFAQLEALEAATAMAVVEWVLSHGPEKARAFHRALRADQPAPPLRVEPDRGKRFRTYDDALRELAGVTLASVDAEWRAWFRAR